jgi:thiamine biosynthesis protein ThiS
MQLSVNGKTEQIDNVATVGDLLRTFDLAPIRVAVEVNKTLVPRKTFDETPLYDGDAVEIVTFVGGG